METSQPWPTAFYTDRRGSSPVQEFLTTLPLKEQMAVLARIEQLRELNIFAREPLAKHLRGNLWELRWKSYRLLYVADSGCLVFLHVFRKTTDKTPERETDTACRRFEEYKENSR